MPVLSFEEQYAQKEIIRVNEMDVEVVDIRPTEEKNPAPVLVAIGWAAEIDSFKPGLEVLFKTGRRVLCLNHPRRGGIIPTSSYLNIERLPAEERRKAHTILGVLKHKCIQKVKVIGHSEAAINVSIAEWLEPERFCENVFYTPAGLIGKDSLFRLVRGVMNHPKRPPSIANIPITRLETDYLLKTKGIDQRYQLANPLRAFKEVLAMCEVEVADMMRSLTKKGLKFAIISGVDDTFFPHERIAMTLARNGRFAPMVVLRGGHMQIQVHYELYMGAAERLLTALENNEDINAVKLDPAITL